MLSILIPAFNYNVLQLVQELHSQAQQANIAFEIIVLDDCSTMFHDSNLKINELQHCRFIRNDLNLGRTSTRHKLAETAQFETLLFLDADVLPSSPQFLNNYISYINKKPVVLGGYAYFENNNPKVSLRWKYGKSREEKPAEERNNNPYASIFSGNILIHKKIFLEHNFSDHGNFYGMDIYFSYQLYKSGIPILHIDNPIYHLGLEENKVFFEKNLQSVVKRKEILSKLEGIEKINSLLKHYLILKKYCLAGIVSLGFKVVEPILKKLILNKNPNLFCLDIYRLGYICSLK